MRHVGAVEEDGERTADKLGSVAETGTEEIEGSELTGQNEERDGRGARDETIERDAKCAAEGEEERGTLTGNLATTGRKIDTHSLT